MLICTCYHLLLTSTVLERSSRVDHRVRSNDPSLEIQALNEASIPKSTKKSSRETVYSGQIGPFRRDETRDMTSHSTSNPGKHHLG